jgi:ribonuclease VapC
MIVETSALVAIIRRESDSSVYLEALEEFVDTARLSAASYFEAAIVTDGSRDAVLSRRLDEFLTEAGIVIEPVTEHQARIAREAYRDFGKGSGHRAQLNFGDCFAYALAKDKAEPLLFKGSDFAHTDVRRAI